MKTININRDSWHYLFARKMGDYDPEVHGADICAYMRRIFVGIIGSAVIAAVVLIIGGLSAWLLGDFIAWLFYVAINGWIAPYIVAGVCLIALTVGAIVLVFWLAVRGTKAAVRSSDVLSAGWDSVHHRICARLEIY